MSGLVDTVMGNLGSDQINAIASKLGTDPDSARNAIEHALPLIVGGMANTASTPDGAGALHSALANHAGTNISDVLGSVPGGGATGGGLGGLLGGGAAGGGAAGMGGAILGHIFGGNASAANQGLGQTTGLGTAGAGQLLAILAPIMMSVLANQAQQQGLSPGGLGTVLGQQSQQIQQQGGIAGGLLSAVLGHSGGQLDLSSLIQGAGGLLNAFGKR
ncbi:MAG: DUF937 domain-containing protein [Rudaea sp.]